MAEVDVGAVAPVVNAPAADAVPAPDLPTVQDEATPDESVKPEKTFTEEEVRKTVNDRLTKERRRIEKNVRLELENQALRRQIEDKAPSPQPAGRPTPEQFAGKPYEEYNEALLNWKLEERLKSLRQETDAQQQARAAQERDVGLAKRLNEGAAKYPDFREVAGAEDVPVTHAMKAAIDKVKNPADVAYYLGSNIDEAQQIASMSDIEQVWAIKDLSAKLSTSAPTKTPAPIKPNSGSGSAPTGYRKDMTDKQYAEWRARQKAR